MLSSAEIAEIKKIYPGLGLVKNDEKHLITGELHFCAFYDNAIDALVINPAQEHKTNENFIEDSFEIEIELLPDFPSSFPLVREVGGRIEQIASKHDIKNISDLHVNKNQNNAVCLCPKPAERLRYQDNIDIVHFLNHLVTPYFYGLSYYDKYKKWPWSEYSHGDLGIFEFYAENASKQDEKLAKNCYDVLKDEAKKIIMIKKDIKGHWPCICGSKKRFRDCHKLALYGIWTLKEIIKS